MAVKVKLAWKVKKELEAYLDRHARALAKAQGYSPCAGCTAGGIRNDVAVPAFTRAGRLCCATPTEENNSGHSIKHGNNCRAYYPRYIVDAEDGDPNLPVAGRILLRHRATMVHERERSRTKRDEKPDSEPEEEQKDWHSENRVAVRKRKRQAYDNAKQANDLALLVELAEQEYGHANFQEVRAYLRASGRIAEFKSLDPLLLFAKNPMFFICMCTDATMIPYESRLTIQMKGQSAFVPVETGKTAYNFRSLLAPFDDMKRVQHEKGPVCSFMLAFRAGSVEDRPGQGDGVPKTFTIIIYSAIPLDDTEMYNWIVDVSRQVDNWRKGTRENLKEKAISCSMDRPCFLRELDDWNSQEDLEDDDRFNPMEMMEIYVTDDLIQRVLRKAEAGEYGDAAKAAFPFALVYASVRCSISAWWIKPAMEIGFGSSHCFVPLNMGKWKELLTRVENKENFYCEMLLAWAGFDGSILPGCFQVLLPFPKDKTTRKDVEEAGADTVVGIFRDIFWRLFKIVPKYYVKICGVKNLVYMSVYKKKERRKIGRKLLPYANGYISWDRRANLVAYANIWPSHGDDYVDEDEEDPEPSQEEIDRTQQAAYEEYLENRQFVDEGSEIFVEDEVDLLSEESMQEDETLVPSLMSPMSAEEKRLVEDALDDNGNETETVAQSGPDSVSRGSIQTLRPTCWLNDEVIHYFLLMLAKRDEEMCKEDPTRKRSHFFKSFFITKLLNEGDLESNGSYSYGNVKRWSKKVPGEDIFNLDKIIFPINQGNNHWVCAVAFMQEKRIQFYDSMGGSGRRYLDTILKYFQDEHKDKKGGPLPDADDWKLVPCTRDTPQQRNGFDCGVFTCMFADFLSKDCPLVFSQDHITQCRERIALSIMNGMAIM